MIISAIGKTSETDVVGSSRPQPGWYLACVQYVSESPKERGKITFGLEVLGGLTPGQQGRVQDERFDLEGKFASRLTRFVLSLLDPISGQKILEPGTEKDIDFATLVGSLLIIEVELNEFIAKDGKPITTTRLARDGTYQPGNPHVAAVASCPEVITAKQWIAANGIRPGDGGCLAVFARANAGAGATPAPAAPAVPTAPGVAAATAANRFANF